MKFKKLMFLVILTILGLFSPCCKKYNKLEQILNLSGDNRTELTKVLEHYSINPKDSLKYRAAYFLIENMSNKSTTTNAIIDKFEVEFYTSLSAIEEIRDIYSDPYINSKIWRTKVERIWQEILDKYKGETLQNREPQPDIKSIKSEFLIENIDNAFNAWAYPWAKHLSFEQFCEYVLPYRFSDEPLESWRPYFMKRYQWVSDSLKDNTDPVEVCRLINKDIASWFYFDGMFNKHPRTLPLSILLKAKIGACPQQAEIASFAMRAMGVAVANEFIPHWGNRSQGHHFSSVISKEGKFIDFLGGELQPGQNEIRDKASKVFRETFSIQPKTIWDNISNNELKSILSRSVDVTSDYIPSSTIFVDLPNNISVKESYLQVFNNTDWVSVTVGEINGKEAIFKDMGRQIVYLPVFLDTSGNKIIGVPFILKGNGVKKTIIADMTKKQGILLDRKYPLQQRIINFSKHMIGGKFQGANISDFRDAIDLFTIERTPDPFLKSYPVKKESQYRYLRYVFPPIVINEYSGNVAEIGFKGFYINKDSTHWLTGDYIGSPELSEYHFKLLFDKKLDNYITIDIADTIIADYPSRSIAVSSTKKKLWVGLDLKKKYCITNIAYCPRNDTNSLYEHCTYELFYWNNNTWKSLGVKKTINNSLYYGNVPLNALFLLRNLTEGSEERIFTYENEKMIFW